ncbi:GH12 family glycosyl hydrolase domain-containing protein, partial [Rhizobium sp.]|uniref:GH12 family glycosyl hydrolase domain-containing protein n=1 Tax=Rhizobium sp. TaxID=391 RepID=UPI0028A5C41E
MSYISLNSDFAAYDTGEYILLNNVWGKGELRNGVDFRQSIEFSLENPAENITFSWDWPYNSVGNIVAYPELIWGDSPFNNAQSEVDDYITHVGDLEKFSVDVAVVPLPGSSYTNISFDLWLTDVPGGDETTITAEVMIWLDWNERPWGTTAVGTYSSGEQTASIYFADGGERPDYIAVLFDKPWLNAEIDLKSILDDLVSKGLVSAEDFIGGHQFGAEISGGQGTLIVDHISTEFAVTEKPAVPVDVPAEPVNEGATQIHEVREFDEARPDQLASIRLYDASWDLISITSFDGTGMRSSINVAGDGGLNTITSFIPGTEAVSYVEVYKDWQLQSRTSYDTLGGIREVLQEHPDGTHEVQRIDMDQLVSASLYDASWDLISITSFDGTG